MKLGIYNQKLLVAAVCLIASPAFAVDLIDKMFDHLFGDINVSDYAVP